MRLLAFNANISQQLRTKYSFALGVLPIALMFLSFIPLWFISKGLGRMLDVQTDAPIKGQPSGLLWMIYFMSAMVILMVIGYLLGFLLNALIMRFIFGWSWIRLREIFLYSQVPDHWCKKSQIKSKTIGYRKLDVILALLFISSLLLFLPEINILDNTLGGLKLFLISSSMGGIAGICMALYFYFSRRFVPDTRLSLIIYFIIIIVVCSLFSATAASRVNRQWASESEYSNMFTIVSKGHSAGHRGPPQWYLYLAISQRIERIQVTEEYWQAAYPGARVKLILREGFFGYPVVVIYERT